MIKKEREQAKKELKNNKNLKTQREFYDWIFDVVEGCALKLVPDLFNPFYFIHKEKWNRTVLHWP